MSEKFYELYQEISTVKSQLDCDVMYAYIAVSHGEGEITDREATILQKCLDAFEKAMQTI